MQQSETMEIDDSPALVGSPTPPLPDGQTVHPLQLAADDVEILVETSSDLAFWSDASGIFTLAEPAYLGNGGQRVTLQAPRASLPAAQRLFVRLKVTLRN